MNAPSFPPPSPPVVPAARGAVATIAARLRAVRRHLDRLVSRDMALGILAGTATTLLLAFVAEACYASSRIGTGRVYTVTYEANDDCGNSTVTTATVAVPLEQP